MLIAFVGGVVGYRLAKKRYLALLDISRAAQADSDATAQDLRELAGALTSGVEQHTSRTKEIEEKLLAVSRSDVDSIPGACAEAAADLQNANTRLQAELVKAKKELEEQSKRLKRQQRETRIDPLTSFPNRLAFKETLQTFAEASRAAHTTGAMLLVEVDRFKETNDRYGNVIGDKVLRHAAQLLREELAGLDVSVARNGGSQFAVIFHNDTLDIVKKVTRDIRQAVLTASFSDETVKIPLTVSSGLTLARSGLSVEDLEAAVAKPLVAAKAAGGNCCFFNNGHTNIQFDPVGVVGQSYGTKLFGDLDHPKPADAAVVAQPVPALPVADLAPAGRERGVPTAATREPDLGVNPQVTSAGQGDSFPPAKPIPPTSVSAMETSAAKIGPLDRIPDREEPLAPSHFVVGAQAATSSADSAAGTDSSGLSSQKVIAPPARTDSSGNAAVPSNSFGERERRVHRRLKSNKIYSVAPYTQGATLDRNAFSDVLLVNVSAGGCAMLLRYRPATDSCVVAMNKKDGVVYLVARIVRVTEYEIDESHNQGFLVGCKFTGGVLANSDLVSAKPVPAEQSNFVCAP